MEKEKEFETKQEETNKEGKFGNQTRGGNRRDKHRASGVILSSNGNARTSVNELVSDTVRYDKDSINFELSTRVAFPFNRGMVIPVEGAEEIAIPGFQAIDYVPVIGRLSGDEGNKQINVFFDRMYWMIQSKTNGVASLFSKGAMVQMMLGMNSLWSLILHARRAISALGYYQDHSYYYPRTFYAALGFNPEYYASDVEHKQQLVVKLNEVIKSLNVMCVPKFVESFHRSLQLSSNIYKEYDHEMSELTIMRPTVGYSWREITTGFDSHLNPTSFNWYRSSGGEQFVSSIEVFISVISNMMQSYLKSQSIKDINSYLIRTFDEANFLKLDLVELEEEPNIVHDHEFNVALANMNLIPIDPAELEEFAMIVEDVGGDSIEWQPILSRAELYQEGYEYAAIRGALAGAGLVLDNAGEDITPEFVMNATRLMPKISTAAVAEDECTVICGTEVPFRSYYYGVDGKGDLTVIDILYGCLVIEGTTDSDSSGITQYPSPLLLTRIMQFAYRPNYSYMFVRTGATPKVRLPFKELDVFTVVREADLNMLNRAALASTYWLSDIPETRVAR